MVLAEKEKGRPSHFRLPKNAAEEEVLANEAVPSFYKVQKQMGFKNISGIAAAKGGESANFRSRSFPRL